MITFNFFIVMILKLHFVCEFKKWDVQICNVHVIDFMMNLKKTTQYNGTTRFNQPCCKKVHQSLFVFETMMIRFELYPKRNKNVLTNIVELTKLEFGKVWLQLAFSEWEVVVLVYKFKHISRKQRLKLCINLARRLWTFQVQWHFDNHTPWIQHYISCSSSTIRNDNMLGCHH